MEIVNTYGSVDLLKASRARFTSKYVAGKTKRNCTKNMEKYFVGTSTLNLYECFVRKFNMNTEKSVITKRLPLFIEFLLHKEGIEINKHGIMVQSLLENCSS